MILLVADNVTHSAVFHLSAPSLKIEMALYITFAAVADCVATIVFCWRLSSNGHRMCSTNYFCTSSQEASWLP
ncbi:hypothetical protein L208DRAFT_918434 [Tricholoma matsutake]|nr:hypothetical protein L208DRAFT_918434 [Tricholoma matsutake 945]